MFQQSDTSTSFIVADDGPSIPDAEKEHIFERFYRAESSHTDHAHFGLGLCTAQEIAGKVWKKEEELKQLKSELAALDRKIQLELAPPTPEITEKEHEGQQVKPEAKGVRNGIRQYPEDTSPQIRNPSESIIANHTITGHPGLYAKEETRSKGLKI